MFRLVWVGLVDWFVCQPLLLYFHHCPETSVLNVTYKMYEKNITNMFGKLMKQDGTVSYELLGYHSFEFNDLKYVKS